MKIYTILYIFIIIYQIKFIEGDCVCEDQSLCGVRNYPWRNEVVGFSSSNNYTQLKEKVDWSRITTLVLVLNENTDPRIICLAHSHGVRVHHRVPFPGYSYDAQNPWLVSNLRLVKEFKVDGLNLDFEMNSNDFQSQIVNELVMRINQLLYLIDPNIQLTYDIPLSPNELDYEFLSKALDYYLVMAYDLNFHTNPLAPNSPLNIVEEGVDFLLSKLKIPASKLVLGLPWYGYYGQCQGMTSQSKLGFQTCNLPSYQIPPSMTYQDILLNLMKLDNSGQLWDPQTMTPYLNWKDENGNIYQIRYDNPRSISQKVSYAKKLKLRGVGVWRIDSIFQLNDQSAKLMWYSLT